MGLSTFESVSAELLTGGVERDLALDSLIELRGRYSEPWRGYHVFEHPLELFDLLHEFGGKVQDPLAVGWTFMYHDAVYDPKLDPKKGLSEERSAQLAEACIPLFAANDLAERVASLTRATFTHVVDPNDYDANFFMDADLAILGSRPERYARYVKGIEFEYFSGNDQQYTLRERKIGRIGILTNLAGRIDGNGLFRTDVFRQKFEDQAQANIANELIALQEEVDA